jgi:two-component system, chemotaxis family, response regulator Rcp1
MPKLDAVRPLRILVVDDSPSDVRLIREALRDSPVDVTLVVARDGVEATDYLCKTLVGQFTRPDLIILDLNLPRKSGREVLAEIKSDLRLKQIPVIVMTSSSASEDVTYAYSLNANSYITKPGDLAEYLRVVRAIQVFWFNAARLPEDELPNPILVSEHASQPTLLQ